MSPDITKADSPVLRELVGQVEFFAPGWVLRSDAWLRAVGASRGVDAGQDAARVGALLRWMWAVLGSHPVAAALPADLRPSWDRMVRLPAAVRPSWDRMVRERTAEAASAAAYAADGDLRARAAADAAAGAASAAALLASATALNNASAVATWATRLAVSAVAWATDASGDPDRVWTLADPAGLLERLVDVQAVTR